MALQDTLEQLQNVDFNDLDLSNIGSWPSPVKIILMVLLFAAVSVGGYFYYLTDKQEALEKFKTLGVNNIIVRDKNLSEKDISAINLQTEY